MIQYYEIFRESVSEDKGQTFPGAGRPFGMTQWTPETRTAEISGLTKNSFYIKSATKNGKKFKGSIKTHKEIMEGSELKFQMTDSLR
jgi:putative alpha-1,2-mannosidase